MYTYYIKSTGPNSESVSKQHRSWPDATVARHYHLVRTKGDEEWASSERTALAVAAVASGRDSLDRKQGYCLMLRKYGLAPLNYIMASGRGNNGLMCHRRTGDGQHASLCECDAIERISYLGRWN